MTTLIGGIGASHAPSIAFAFDARSTRVSATPGLDRVRQFGTTSVASISTFARSSINATTCTAVIAGKCRPISSR